jgi:DNA-binding NarL/FixJ family response regulator
MTTDVNAVFIIGPNALQNELLASLLEKEIPIKCLAMNSASETTTHHQGDGGRPEGHILLYDCMGKDVEACMEECAFSREMSQGAQILCFFNLKKGTEVKKSFLGRGVRGFFFLGEPFQHLVKGVRAVLKGELWVSRKIMSELINETNQVTRRALPGKLSRREVDILTMIVEGATNDDIADKLCISKHTVKTHLYNIFKKIDVKSRFQAALWGAKNL